MTAYYNEIDPYAAQWLRHLIQEELIADGEVDTRSIADVRPVDLRGYTQCHFFAGLGGWSGALRLAGFSDHRPVWTGSCPCQPFSLAGKQGGFADERHLWPYWRYLIAQRRPAKVYGEQVASAAQWLGLVRSDLEALDYAVGAIPIEAASVGANHKRDRLWFVAHAHAHGAELWDQPGWRSRPIWEDPAFSCDDGQEGLVADAKINRRLARRQGDAQEESERRQSDRGRIGALLANAPSEPAGRATEPWAQRNHWLIEPDVGRVAHGVPARVAKLRALGNAIVPQVAAQFIRATM